MYRVKFVVISLVVIVLSFSICRADDTEVYTPKVKNNVMIMLDTSTSMGYGVYDNGVDYHAFYRYICEQSNLSPVDTIMGGSGTNAYFYPDYRADARNEIYLVKGNIGYATDANGNGMTGDAADPDYSWYAGNMIDTGTSISADGTLSGGDLSVDANGQVLYNGSTLPNGRAIDLHKWQNNGDGSQTDQGFAGMLTAPGYYFSGYFGTTNSSSSMTSTASDAAVENGKKVDWFFITGNWMNMQMVYNLQVTDNNKDYRAWEYVTYPETITERVDYDLRSSNIKPGVTDYSNVTDYLNDYDSDSDSTVSYDIYSAGAGTITLHFDWLQLADKGDKIYLSDGSGATIQTIEGPQSSTDFTSDAITGDTVHIRFVTNKSGQDKGWHIDYIEAASSSGSYQMSNRMQIVAAAIQAVLIDSRIGGQINWGLMYLPGSGSNSSSTQSPLNPNFNDDSSRNNIITYLDKRIDKNASDYVAPSGNAPLGGALQDVFNYFNGHQNLHYDCNRNYVIVLTSGYASGDDTWDKISGVDFTDAANHDSVQYTEDPFQYSDPPNEYYDDIAYYLFSHSWVDQSLIPTSPTDLRPSSADNITTDTIGMTPDQPMLQHASDVTKVNGVASGLFLAAYSKSELESALYSLGLTISKYSSYTAPVVSVDETNRVQSGDKLYMAVFKPNEGDYWTGNLKKYGIESTIRSECSSTTSSATSSSSSTSSWYVVDKNGNYATDCDGNLLSDTVSYWSPTADGGEVEAGGAGQYLYDNIPEPTASTTALTASAVASWPTPRYIKTYLGASDGTLVTVATDTLTNGDLNVTSDADRYKIINYLYGFTYDANSTTGAPIVKRSWPLGAIIHSAPKLIDYFDTNNQLTKRLIAVGANDGMLHVFDDDSGREVFAFVPPGILPHLTDYDPTNVTTANGRVYSVDGSPALVTVNGKSLLVFGLRRGGRAYYALDVTNPDPSQNPDPSSQWTQAWEITNGTTGYSELGYSWATPQFAKIKTDTGDETVMIIPGGYDPAEDNLPTGDSTDYYMPAGDTMGRALYVVNAANGSLLKSYSYSSSDPTLSQMKYCFPADPTVITDSSGYMLAAYETDIYGQIWKLSYTDGAFDLSLIFKTNPETDQESAYKDAANFLNWNKTGDPRKSETDTSISYITVASGQNQGGVMNPRKVFYSPDVSYAGNSYTDVPVLYMGTGDRAHPAFTGSSGSTGTNDGLYAFYDAEAYYKANATTGSPPYDSTSDYFTEKDLLNVSCGALEQDESISGYSATQNATIKSNIQYYLQNMAKGWYIRFDDVYDECPAAQDPNSAVALASHAGEKSISPVTLFAKVVYDPTFTPGTSTDPCSSSGTGRMFAVNFDNGNSVYDYYTGNDGTTNTGSLDVKYNRFDRYQSIGNQISSGLTILIRNGTAAGFISTGNQLVELPTPFTSNGVIPFYWTEIRTAQ